MLATSGLDRLLEPQLPRLYQLNPSHEGGLGPTSKPGPLKGARELAAVLMTAGLFLFPLGFEVFAFYRLFDEYGFEDLLLWVVLVFSTLAMFSTIATFVASYKRPARVFGPLASGPADS